jgi:hypothetical protein
MLVLAMEFSRGAQRGNRAVHIKNRPTCRRDTHGRAAGPRPLGRAGIALEGRNRPGLLDEQEPGVAPSKRNSDAHCHPQSPQASRTGPPKRCGPPGAGVGLTANSQ